MLWLLLCQVVIHSAHATFGVLLDPLECRQHCLNGASCVSVNGTIVKCVCPNDFSGARCEVPSRGCPIEDCANGASCVLKDLDKSGQALYACVCLQGYSGDRCQFKNDCAQPCPADSLCQSGSCECIAGTIGQPGHCAPAKCRPNVCLNNGQCVESDGLHEAYCQCQSDFTGRLCHLKKNAETSECYDGRCPPGYVCENTPVGFSCLCPKGFSGPGCKIALKEDCASKPCENNGLCVADKSGFQCRCSNGFDGPFCQFDMDECQQLKSVCEHGTCKNTFGSYTCTCEPGWSGPNCDQRESCEEDYCKNGGSCFIRDGVMQCQCPPSFEGSANCEAAVVGAGSIHCNSDDDCHNGGKCVVSKNASTCHCPPEFGGPKCESRHSCPTIPCLNNGLCKFDSRGVGSCQCVQGYHGKFCEYFAPNVSVRLKPSSSFCYFNPCQNGGECDEMTKTCACPPNFQGPLCQLDVDECVDRVQHCPANVSLGCLNAYGSYSCHCRRGYAGKNCLDKLKPCDDRMCKGDRQECVVDFDLNTNRQSSRCQCTADYARLPDCTQSTIASFSGNSIMAEVDMTKKSVYRSKFDFRTTLEGGLLLSGDDVFNRNVFQVLLQESALEIVVYKNVLTIGDNLNTGNWIHVSLQAQDDVLVVKVVKDEENVFWQSVQLDHSWASVIISRFGGAAVAHGSYRPETVSNFVGCMRNIVLNGKLLLSSEMGSTAVNVMSTCLRQPQCTPNACFKNSRCRDLWDHFRCDCIRPHFGPECNMALSEATFGYEGNNSFLLVNVSHRHSLELGQQGRFDLSMLIRTTAPDGVLLYADGVGSEQTEFIAVQIRNGCLRLVSILSNGTDLDTCRNVINDGQVHLIQLVHQSRVIKLSVDGQVASSVLLQVNGKEQRPIFLVDAILIGSHPSTVWSAGHWLERALPLTTDLPFKGTIQDVRLNDKLVNMFSESVLPSNLSSVGLVTLNRILRGTHSDDVCRSKPCQNGGECTATFNDYKCFCPKEWLGKDCSVAHPCNDEQVCPAGYQCHLKPNSLKHDCHRPVTFGNASVAVVQSFYQNYNSDQLIKLSVKTRSSYGRIVASVQPNNQTMDLVIVDGKAKLFLIDGENVRTVHSPFPLSDGQWHTVVVRSSPGSVTMTIDEFTKSHGTVDIGQIFGNPFVMWHFGFLEDNSVHPVLDDIPSVEGCLRDVQLSNGLYAPFTIPEIEERLEGKSSHRLIRLRAVDFGCTGKPMCTLHGDCMNGATCHDLWNAYECQCASGYTGARCEEDIDECQKAVCENGGSCVDMVGVYRCDCAAGWQGERCEHNVDECLSSPCQNGGQCVDKIGDFDCICPSNFTGKMCQTPVYVDCSSSPCTNGATCQDVPVAQNQKSFACLCPAGYFGRFCEKQKDFCEGIICLNNGTCQSKMDTLDFQCDCVTGYEGSYCEREINECDSNPCQNAGTCVDKFNGFACKCAEGWTGSVCNVDLDECLSNPCMNGECMNIQGGFYCQCPPYYSGNFCEIAGSCALKPCKHGDCVQLSSGEYVCRCHKGYSGDQCVEMIDFCESNPCNDGGRCISYPGGYNCSCYAGFEGTDCNVNIDDCASKPCQNGGSCVDGINEYKCDCSNTGYWGTTCSVDVNECAIPGKCVHGVCRNDPGSFTCTCSSDYVGVNCDIINPCMSNETQKCRNGGFCMDAYADEEKKIAKYKCSCPEPFQGDFCEHYVQHFKAELIPLEYVIGPVVGIVLIVILFGLTMLVVFARKKNGTRGTYSPSTQENSNARISLHTLAKPPPPPAERLI